ncbi:MAG: hypothetical protein AB1540_06930 [Bdellovibrionota bacterium]
MAFLRPVSSRLVAFFLSSIAISLSFLPMSWACESLTPTVFSQLTWNNYSPEAPSAVIGVVDKVVNAKSDDGYPIQRVYFKQILFPVNAEDHFKNGVLVFAPTTCHFPSSARPDDLLGLTQINKKFHESYYGSADWAPLTRSAAQLLGEKEEFTHYYQPDGIDFGFENIFRSVPSELQTVREYFSIPGHYELTRVKWAITAIEKNSHPAILAAALQVLKKDGSKRGNEKTAKALYSLYAKEVADKSSGPDFNERYDRAMIIEKNISWFNKLPALEWTFRTYKLMVETALPAKGSLPDLEMRRWIGRTKDYLNEITLLPHGEAFLISWAQTPNIRETLKPLIHSALARSQERRLEHLATEAKELQQASEMIKNIFTKTATAAESPTP